MIFKTKGNIETFEAHLSCDELCWTDSVHGLLFSQHVLTLAASSQMRWCLPTAGLAGDRCFFSSVPGCWLSQCQERKLKPPLSFYHHSDKTGWLLAATKWENAVRMCSGWLRDKTENYGCRSLLNLINVYKKNEIKTWSIISLFVAFLIVNIKCAIKKACWSRFSNTHILLFYWICCNFCCCHLLHFIFLILCTFIYYFVTL